MCSVSNNRFQDKKVHTAEGIKPQVSLLHNLHSEEHERIFSLPNTMPVLDVLLQYTSTAAHRTLRSLALASRRNLA